MGVKLFVRYPNTGEIEFDLPTGSKKKISDKIKRVLRSDDKYLAVDVDEDNVEYILGTDLLQKSFITIVDVEDKENSESTKSSGKIVLLGDFDKRKDSESVEKSNE